MLTFVCSVGNIPLAPFFGAADQLRRRGRVHFRRPLVICDSRDLPEVLRVRSPCGGRVLLVAMCGGADRAGAFRGLGLIPSGAAGHSQIFSASMSTTTRAERARLPALLWLVRPDHAPLAASIQLCGMMRQAPAKGSGKSHTYFSARWLQEHFEADPHFTGTTLDRISDLRGDRAEVERLLKHLCGGLARARQRC